MYKSSKTRFKLKPTTAPKPVFVSQKPVDNKNNKNDEDEVPSSQPNSQHSGDEDHEMIPSSQNENVSQNTIASQTQSRFLSQRHQITRPTQEHEIRGKNYFEIALISCKVQISSVGCEFMMEGDDPISFTRRFRAFLGSSEGGAKRFIAGFKKAFSLDEDFIEAAQKFLTGCIMKESEKSHQSQTSLIQCFFAVAQLKDEIAQILLDNLKAYVVAKGDQSDGFIVGLVVAQFKFSDQLLATNTYNIIYEQFFEILAAAKNDACREVIISNFRDLDEFKQDDAVKRLMNMYEDDYKLLTPFIETFTEMCISEDTKTRVTSLVQHLFEDRCHPKLYPGIVKYLLCYTELPTEIVDNLRANLNFSVDVTARLNEIKIKVCQLLEKSFRREKSKIAEAWIKILTSLEDPKDLKSIDFVMMLMITSIKEEKFAAIKKILLQKIPEGFFSDEFLQLCFKTFPLVIAQYSGTLLELLGAIQKNNIYEINEFSSACFKELFGLKLSDKKEIIGSLAQFLCEKTPGLPFSPRSDFKMMTLNILGEISKKQSSAEALLMNHKILLRVLDNSKVKLTFNEHRLVMELLCKLAYATNYRENNSRIEALKFEEERAILQEHLEMMTNKLMCNPDLSIKQLGIIGAIKIVSSLVVNFVSSSEIQSQNISIDAIPEGPIRDAAKRVDFIIQSVRGSPQGFALICDEMTLEFQGKRDQFEINEIFLAWLSEMLLKKLDDFILPITRDLPEHPDIKLAHQLRIDQFSQPTDSIGLGLMVFEKKSDDVIYFSPLFKIMRLLMMHRYHNLQKLHEFAVMPIVLTDTFGSAEDELSGVDEDLAKRKLDLYFHCINWLRELIGTFCHWTEEDQVCLTEVVTRRLKQLVHVEHRLSQLLPEMPANYYPPPTVFLDIEANRKSFDQLRREKKTAAKPPKKTRRKNDSTIANTTEARPVEPMETNNKIRPFCREIDSHFILMLQEDFKISNDDITDSELGLQELMFLLDDFYHKISSTLNAGSSEQKGFYDPVRTINELKETIVVYLVKIFQNICKELVSLSQKADDDDSNDIFYTNDANMLKGCYCMILKLLDVVYSCPQLKLQRNKELLNDALQALIPPNLLNEDVQSQDDICKVIIKHLFSYKKNVKNCESAVALVKFLLTISSFSSNTELRKMIIDLCEKFLKKEWKNSAGDDDSGAAFNANLEKLLQMFVSDATITKIDELVTQMHLDFKHIIAKQLSYQQTFPSFNKGNSIFMMRTYFARLSAITTAMDPANMNYLFFMKNSKMYQHLYDIVKCIGTQSVAIIFLRNFLIFMKAFNTQGLAVLKQCVGNKNKFLDLVKDVQIVTRASHGVSCDLKHRKNKAVIPIIPKLREALMRKFQGVCSLLPLVKIERAIIYTGALKNFDMDGAEIWSQTTTVGNEVDEEEEEEEPMEVSDDENLDDSNDTTSHHTPRSRSTVY